MQPSDPAWCLTFALDVCVIWDARVAFWEITITALIAALTIVASVALSLAVARSEVRRHDVADRVIRRGRMVREFADLGAELLHLAERNEFPPGRISQFTARMSTEVGVEDLPAVGWMQDAIAELVAELRSHPEGSGMVVAGQALLSQRVAELSAWPRSDLTWDQYVKLAEIEAIIPWRERSNGSGAAMQAAD